MSVKTIFIRASFKLSGIGIYVIAEGGVLYTGKALNKLQGCLLLKIHTFFEHAYGNLLT